MSNAIGQFGDTTLTKVFVGGLAWETPKEAMRDHFEKYGEILEAVIISDKLTGRSKGYGFVSARSLQGIDRFALFGSVANVRFRFLGIGDV